MMPRVGGYRAILSACLLFWAATLPVPAAAQSLFERLVLPGDLTQSHAKLQKDCANCHEDFSKGAQVQLCLDCHKEIAGDLKADEGFHGRTKEAQARDCAHCHTDHKGRDFGIILFDMETFDHGRSDFPLTGAHARVDCSDCHAEGKKFRDTPTGCFDCHRDDDRHKGELGKECANCHVTSDWAQVSAFDHSKTDFPLTDAHELVPCAGCHAGDVYKDLPTTCVGCHLIQDIHADRFGEKCETCHRATKWTEIRFDHDRDTKFRLDGSHARANCNDCHTQNAYEHKTSDACSDCHGRDDPHRGALGPACETCHSTQSWAKDVTFDHDFTNFPLIGQHQVVACESCHTDLSFRAIETDCIACHAKKDVHKATLGPDCATCHNPNGWRFWIFDHNTQTDFRLTGAHGSTACAQCHTKPVQEQPKLSRTCLSCHRKDDVHRGQFGNDCARCHSTTSFKGARLR